MAIPFFKVLDNQFDLRLDDHKYVCLSCSSSPDTSRKRFIAIILMDHCFGLKPWFHLAVLDKLSQKYSTTKNSKDNTKALKGRLG